MADGVFPPELAKLTVEHAGQQYTPSNGTEGEAFWSWWCNRCERDKVMNGTVCEADAGDDDMCQILGASFRGEAKEWVYGHDGQPMCAAFVPMGDKPHEARCEHTQELF